MHWSVSPAIFWNIKNKTTARRGAVSTCSYTLNISPPETGLKISYDFAYIKIENHSRYSFILPIINRPNSLILLRFKVANLAVVVSRNSNRKHGLPSGDLIKVYRN